MNNIDLEVIRKVVDWLSEGDPVVLMTVCHTWGSSPRQRGAMMAVRADGRFCGSLSGGCIEDELLRDFKEAFPNRLSLQEFGVSTDQAASRGLPCGGRLQLVVEPLSEAGPFERILDALLSRHRIKRVLDLASGQTRVVAASRTDESAFDGRSLEIVFEPDWRLIVIGAGQLSAYLCEFARPLGYDIVVCDPRTEYRDAWPLSDIAVNRDMPDDLVIGSRCDELTAVVALTHDPKLDDLAVMEALTSAAFYVGALGSLRTNASRRERLAEHFDLTESQLARLHGPVGIDLNTRTPPEIALSIMVDITACRNGIRISTDRVA
jgi:xanthine dehydrogenase accessory factor